MPKQCNKLAPSELDYDVWRMFALEGRSREQIAERLGKSIACIDYHIVEGKRLIGIDVVKAKEESQRLMIPIAFQGLQLIAKTFASQNPKYVDAAIKFLRNAGYTIEQSEVTVTNKDNRDASADFDAVMQKVKSRAVDAEIVNVGSTSPDSESTSTSTSESLDSILPLDKSQVENPKSDKE